MASYREIRNQAKAFKELHLKLLTALTTFLILGLGARETSLGAAESFPDSLSLGVFSSEKPTEAARKYLPLTRALEAEVKRRLGSPVTIHISILQKYKDASRFLNESEVDFVEMGAAAYVQAKKQNPELDLLAIRSPRDSTLLGGVICVKSGSAIERVEQLRGKSVAFVDELSTTGHFLSQDYLLRRGVHSRDLRTYAYLGSHMNVAKAVLSGEFDAGAINEEVLRRVNAASVTAPARLRSICRFRNYGRPWVARGTLPVSVREALRQGLVAIQDGEVLGVIGEKDMVMLPADDSEFEQLRHAIRENESFFRSGSDPD